MSTMLLALALAAGTVGSGPERISDETQPSLCLLGTWKGTQQTGLGTEQVTFKDGLLLCEKGQGHYRWVDYGNGQCVLLCVPETGCGMGIAERITVSEGIYQQGPGRLLICLN